MKIELKSGKTFSVLWCGESTIDGKLRLCVTGLDFASAFNVFGNPVETEEIKYYINDSGDGEFKAFTGYSSLRGVNADNNGVVIALAKGD